MPKSLWILPRPSPASTMLAAAYGALFAGMGIHLPFFPLWLADRGLTPAEIAIVTALPLLQRTLTLPAITGLADRMGPLKWSVSLYAAVSCLTVALYLVSRGFWEIAAVTLMSGLFWTALVPVLDALTFAVARSGGGDYGRIRLWGSITFMVAAAVGGVAIQAYGVWLVVPGITGTLMLLTIVGLLLPAETRTQAPARRSIREGWSLLLRAPGVLPVLLGVSLIQTSHALFYTFGSVHLKQQGYSEGTIGLLWAGSIVSEIAFFAVSGLLVARWGVSALLSAAAGAALVRWFAMGFDPPLPVLAGAQALHALTFAACHVSTVFLIARTVPVHYAATAQGAFFALHGGINGSMMLLSGPIYATLAGQGYFVMLAVAVAGGALLMLGLPRLSQPQSAASGG